MNDINFVPTVNMVEIVVETKATSETVKCFNDYAHKAWDIFLGTNGYVANNVITTESQLTKSDVLGQTLWMSGEDRSYPFDGCILGENIETEGDPDDLVEVEENFNHMGNTYTRNTRTFSFGYGEIDKVITHLGLKNEAGEYITHLKLAKPLDIKPTHRVVVRYTTLFRDGAVVDGEFTEHNTVEIGSGVFGEKEVEFTVTTNKYNKRDNRLVFLTDGLVGETNSVAQIGYGKKTTTTDVQLLGVVDESVNGRTRSFEIVMNIAPMSKTHKGVHSIVVPYGKVGEITIKFSTPVEYPANMGIKLIVHFRVVTNQEVSL